MEKDAKRKMLPTSSVSKDSSLNYRNTITNFKSLQKYEIKVIIYYFALSLKQ